MQRRNLPHIYPEGAKFFITFRLKNSIPLDVLEKMQEERKLEQSMIEKNNKLSEKQKKDILYKIEKRFFGRYDKALEKYATDDDYLRNPQVAQIVAAKLHEFDKKDYDLMAYCIMSNHVHLLFDTANYPNTSISNTMNYIKGNTAYECNKMLNRQGSFWQKESYDHFVRDNQELERIIDYIIQNPVKAGLIKYWKEWKFTYLYHTF
ncbi:MAG: transposase [Bernardetiaceae bacterium]|nr:transposase [Bernardetiaceae bacterium]